MSARFLSHSSCDLTTLLNSGRKYDVVINVGRDINKKEFRVHSIILETRSAYFARILSTRRIEEIIYTLDFPDISARIFDILIRYLYGGTINVILMGGEDVFNLLVTCKKFRVEDLYDYLQDYLIEHQPNWLILNFALVRKVSFESTEFIKLQNYWKTTVCKRPEIVFHAKDFTSIDKEALLSLYKYDGLSEEEDVLWEHLIRWGKAQSSELSTKEITNWTTFDFNILKKILIEFIPLIRFYDISSENFYRIIIPYNEILPADLYNDLLRYYLIRDWQPKVKTLPSRKTKKARDSRKSDSKIFQTPEIKRNPTVDPIGSKIIDDKQAALISSWIQGNKENRLTSNFNGLYYEFRLLVRGSRDGMTSNKFHEMCDGKGPTITIVRTKDNNLIFGGYNPVSWYKSNGKWENTSDSFIFSLNEKPVISRVQIHNKAICQSDTGPNFNEFKLNIGKKMKIQFKRKNPAYIEILHVEGNFSIDEYEVFSVVRRRQ